ncbi:hypothetical protein HOD05_04215 [Candidatus Woesearchaeota archaeon]|jgi:hypothetical protein|nr:hypothetical protein [Candidatus Woesearchaeota archaeon]MBT4150719.1 hypothetical protein [Candidatus Woesearchaeota archaeon]MBT4247529.1 hypothetical protein [Candidatus Woesearchaeota archaeon]MBT4434400.1 hypothetical protein [Candidatus Woesearchaeota archaeon]MBT7331931.1 hypothetical protein [Candidatus Woesearchaeota archaeon]
MIHFGKLEMTLDCGEENPTDYCEIEYNGFIAVYQLGTNIEGLVLPKKEKSHRESFIDGYGREMTREVIDQPKVWRPWVSLCDNHYEAIPKDERLDDPEGLKGLVFGIAGGYGVKGYGVILGEVFEYLSSRTMKEYLPTTMESLKNKTERHDRKN